MAYLVSLAVEYLLAHMLSRFAVFDPRLRHDALHHVKAAYRRLRIRQIAFLVRMLISLFVACPMLVPNSNPMLRVNATPTL